MTNLKNANRQRLFTINETASELRISEWLVYKLINKKLLTTLTIESRRLVAEEDLENFINSRKSKDDAS
jgi:hypothetical protein